jgi:tetratricopeptide (TPR) repeat protein
VQIGERIDVWREKIYDLGVLVTRKFMPDLAPPADRGLHKEAVGILEKGRKAYNAKNYPRAEEHFRQAILADESYSKAHYYLGLALYKQSDSQGAVRAWTRATEVDPTGTMGLKAARKVNYVKKGLSRTIDELKDRLR